MKTLKVLLQEVVSGIKAWVNSNFAQESNTVHKTGNETITGSKLFTAYVQVNNRVAYRDTSVVDKTGSDVYRAVDTYAHQGNDGAYWGGLKHLWFADGKSALELAVANHKLDGSTWTQGFWSINLGASKDFSSVYFAPTTNNSIDLGTSTNQWNNLFAKNYFYNGIQWGLDQANVWSAENTYTNTLLTLKHTALEIGVLPASNQTKRYRFTDKYNADLGWLQHRVNTSGDSYLECYVVNKFSNGQLSAQGSEIANTFALGLHSDGSRYFTVAGDVYPDLPTRVCNLGTTTNKWKSLNGVNPGALSLPDGGVSTSIQIDTTDWDLTGQNQNNVLLNNTPGYLWVSVPNVSGNYIYARRYQAGGNMQDCRLATGDGYPDIFLIFPLTEGNALVKVKSDTVSARFYPCKGNV